MFKRGVSRKKIAEVMGRTVVAVDIRIKEIRRRGDGMIPASVTRTAVRTFLDVRDVAVLRSRADKLGMSQSDLLREAALAYLGKQGASPVELAKINQDLKDRVKVLEIKLDKVKRAWMD